MKFFIDTANVSEIQEFAWLVDGVTTNPSLVAKENRPFEEVIREICGIVDGPISAEATALDTDGMVKEGRALAKIHENVVVKIPMTEPGMKAVQILTADEIATNVTLVFSVNQALLAAKCGATYVSPFIGRIDDTGSVGMDLVAEIVDLYGTHGFLTEVLAASVRHPEHVREAALVGADVATVPYGVLKKLFDHPLTDIGLERFLKDWENVPK